MTDPAQWVAAPIPSMPEPDWPLLSRLPITGSPERLIPMSLAPPPIRVFPAYARLGVPDAINECYLREGVYRRLLAVARSLPQGLTLLVLDGWRPWRVQQYLFETLSDTIRDASPGINEHTLRERTREFVSLPSRSPDAPSPHLTGGAVDVTLCDADGLPLDMGTLFDEAVPASHAAALETQETEHSQALSQDLSQDLSQARPRDNRRLLYHAMLAQGFTNLPSEWWHFDYGDQLWAHYHGYDQAIYGPAELDTIENRWRRQL